MLNPAAGGGRCRRRAAPILARLLGSGLDIEVRETRAPGDGTAIARRGFAEGFRSFIAVGGDGTAFEVLNGILPPSRSAGEAASLGLLPVGTGNSFLRDFSDDGVEHTCAALLQRRLRPCDVLRFQHDDGELFAMGIVSFGLPAEVASLVNRRLKPLGEIGYALGVLLHVARLSTTTLHLAADDSDGGTREVTMLCVSNSRFVGGRMLVAPHADIADGRADVVDVAPVGRLDLLRTFPKIFKGTHLSHPAVDSRRARALVVRSERPLEIMIDGEVLTATPRRIDVLAAAVEIYA